MDDDHDPKLQRVAVTFGKEVARNCYECRLGCVPCVCHILPLTAQNLFWAEFAAQNKCSHLLKVILVEKEEDKLLVYTECFDTKFGEWVCSNPLAGPNGLTAPFRRILRGILGGYYFLGNRPRITGFLKTNSIFVQDGRAKLAYFWEVETVVKYPNPYLFANLIGALFGGFIPPELSCLCDRIIKNEKVSKVDFVHPCLLAPKARNDLRSRAFQHIVEHHKNVGITQAENPYEKQLNTVFTALTQRPGISCVEKNWFSFVPMHFHEALDYRPYHSSLLTSFLRFNENVLDNYRMKLRYTEEQIDLCLNIILPGFLPAVHQIMHDTDKQFLEGTDTYPED